jgi:hypothetical protein
VKSSSTNRYEPIDGFLSPHPARKPATDVAVQEVDLPADVLFHVKNSGSLVCFQHLKDVGGFETGQVSRELAGLASSMVGDLALASQYELFHAERFENVVVRPRVQAGEALFRAGVAGQKNARCFSEIRLDT